MCLKYQVSHEIGYARQPGDGMATVAGAVFNRLKEPIRGPKPHWWRYNTVDAPIREFEAGPGVVTLYRRRMVQATACRLVYAGADGALQHL